MQQHQKDRKRRRLANRHHREARSEFLASSNNLLRRTTKLLAAGLDEEATLVSVAQLVLPRPGVWLLLDVHASDGSRRIVVSKNFAHHAAATQALASGWPSIHELPGAKARAIRNGRSDLVPALTEEMLIAVARSPEQLALLRELEIGSVLTVALTAAAEPLGTLTFFGPRSGPPFDEPDRLLAEDLAVGAALAIANSRLLAAREQTHADAQATAAQRLAFISSLSHGLRTPLHAIHGFAQLLIEGVHGPLNDGQRKDVQRIQANERHLLHLVNSVLSYARWDDEEQLTLEDISVRSAVRQANPVVVRAAAGKGVMYDPERDALDARLMVRAEPRRLREILLQLMLNAVKFSRSGDSLVVQAMTVGDRIWIRVTDTGAGIAKQDLESIFLPFKHADHGAAANGVGLGLAFTRKMTRAMGGELSVISEPGHGSTFTLALPCGRLS